MNAERFSDQVLINRASANRLGNLPRRSHGKFEPRGGKAHARDEITLKGTGADRIATSFRDLKACIAILAPQVREGSINETVPLKCIMRHRPARISRVKIVGVEP